MRSARITALTLISFSALVASVATMTAPAGCAGSPPCEINSDCIEGLCIDGTCKRQCADSERDCGPGFRCKSGQCIPDEGTGGSGPGGSGGGGAGMGGASASSSSMSASASSSAASSGPGASSSASGSASSSGASGSGGGGGGTKMELDLCAADAECASALVCRGMWKGGPQRCTRACAFDSGCPSGMRCSAVGGEKFCTTSDIGKPCSDASACNFACIPGPGYCTAACTTGADCPNGYGCSLVGGTKVCVKAAAYCDAQNTGDCVVPAACDQSSLVVGACTLACDSAADCPQRASVMQKWSCNGICQRPPDVFGPLEGGYAPALYACNAFGKVVNLCNDAQHMDFQQFSIPPQPAVNCANPFTTDGLPGDACVDSCRYQGGCPFGFGCTAVGNVGGARIGLCLPTGAGEVGAACANDTQCAFGHCNSGKCSRDCSADGVCPSGSACTAVGGGAPIVEGIAFKRCQ
jgi:hypothetical protein